MISIIVIVFQYDEYKSPMENIGLQDSLLSRFDVIFIVLDTVSWFIWIRRIAVTIGKLWNRVSNLQPFYPWTFSNSNQKLF